ncbi:MAG: hypothetical protein ABI415_09010 [Flavitalea sp.]
MAYTGTGLRFKVASARGVEFADVFYNEHGMLWSSSIGKWKVDNEQ